MMIDYIGHKDRMPSFLKMSEHFLCETKGLMQNDVLQVGAFFSSHVAGGNSVICGSAI